MDELIKANGRQQLLLFEAIEMLEELQFNMGMFQNQRFGKLKAKVEHQNKLLIRCRESLRSMSS